MSLAVSANLKDLMSHAACQLLISDLWMGGMKIRKYITYKVIAALLFPPFIFAIQFKSAAELQYMPQTQEEYEQQLESQDQSDDSSDESSNDSVSLRNNTKKEDISKIQKTSDGKLPDLEGEGGANGDNKYTVKLKNKIKENLCKKGFKKFSFFSIINKLHKVNSMIEIISLNNLNSNIEKSDDLLLVPDNKKDSTLDALYKFYNNKKRQSTYWVFQLFSNTLFSICLSNFYIQEWECLN